MRTVSSLACVAALALSLVLSGMPAGEGASPPAAPAAGADEQRLLAQRLAHILFAAELVIADNQTLIDDPAKGDKGLSADVVLAKAEKNYLAATKEPFPTTTGDSRSARSIRTLISIIRAVMDKAQPLINESGKGYKAFLPPIFADQVAREFCRAMDGSEVIRISAPVELIRNRRHRPDDWEKQVIETRFTSPTWEKGAAFVERSDYKGRPGTRYLLPEYYVESCLVCHGEPKGAFDMNGGVKEGAKLGDLGGVISVVVYDGK